jgi:amidase
VSNPRTHTAGESVDLLAAGSATAVELTRYYLQRIRRLNPDLNAVIAVDEAGALAASVASDQRRAGGRILGPLDGVPVLIKDNIEAVGLPGTAGSRALCGSPAVRDADIVARLRAGGLVVLGSTNLSEWANFRSTASTSGWSAVGGQTNNPYDRTRNTSGSSSGSAVAASAGLAPLTIGTETDGSIVSPAGLCGVVGFKPTRGTVPGTGIVPLSSRQDVAGPITRSVADAAALYSVIASAPVTVAPLDLADLRVSRWLPDGADESVRAVLDSAVTLLSAAGAVFVAGTGHQAGPFESAEFQALLSEFAVELPAYLAGRKGDHPRTWPELLAFNRADDVELSRFSDDIFELAATAPAVDSSEYLLAREQADAAASAALESALAGCDLAITLTNRPAWPTSYGQGEHDHLTTSSPSAVTGAPSITLPGGYHEGLPIGLSLLGRHGQDEQLLSFALTLEALLPPRRDPNCTA